jgi:hypothetical protein
VLDTVNDSQRDLEHHLVCRFRVSNVRTGASTLHMSSDNQDGTYTLQLPLVSVANYSVALLVGGSLGARGVVLTLEVVPGSASSPVCHLDNINSSGAVRAGEEALIQVIILSCTPAALQDIAPEIAALPITAQAGYTAGGTFAIRTTLKLKALLGTPCILTWSCRSACWVVIMNVQYICRSKHMMSLGTGLQKLPEAWAVLSRTCTLGTK